GFDVGRVRERKCGVGRAGYPARRAGALGMSAAKSEAMSHPAASKLRQFYALTKPRVIQLIVFCALIGMVLAVPGVPGLAELQRGALACVGIWLVAGAAAAFNCLVEKGIDAKM